MDADASKARQCNISHSEFLAARGNIDAIINWVNEGLESVSCPEETRRMIDVATDEIAENISSYAYGNEGGSIYVDMTVSAGCITLCFKDSGAPFNPLEEKAPDFSDDPKIGGLGIYFVKNIMDELSYEYAGGMNIFTVSKKW